MNSRQAVKDTSLPRGGGPDGKSPIFIKKDTIIPLGLYSMHRRKDLWGPDAEEFRPERWENMSLSHHWAYLPFSGGPRICLGRENSSLINYIHRETLQLLTMDRTIRPD